MHAAGRGQTAVTALQLARRARAARLHACRRILRVIVTHASPMGPGPKPPICCCCATIWLYMRACCSIGDCAAAPQASAAASASAEGARGEGDVCA